MKEEELTKDIIGAAITVLKALKPGLDEKLYENALVIELQERGHEVEQQHSYPVYYRSHYIGRLTPDLLVDGKVIADPKVVSEFNDTHVAQMLGYLNITGLEVALLLSFKEATLKCKRVVTDALDRSNNESGESSDLGKHGEQSRNQGKGSLTTEATESTEKLRRDSSYSLVSHPPCAQCSPWSISRNLLRKRGLFNPDSCDSLDSWFTLPRFEHSLWVSELHPSHRPVTTAPQSASLLLNRNFIQQPKTETSSPF